MKMKRKFVGFSPLNSHKAYKVPMIKIKSPTAFKSALKMAQKSNFIICLSIKH